MKILTSPHQILPFVEQWVELLAQDDYEQAFDLLYHPPDDPWTPALLRQLVANYGSPEPSPDGQVFQITSPQTVTQPPDLDTSYKDVDWFNEQEKGRMPWRVGMVHYDVPLNGEMSDLTAIFYINTHEDGYVLQLEDMHVL